MFKTNNLEYLYHKVPDFKITPYISIKHHTYKEIVEYGENKYIEEMLYLMQTADDLKVIFWDSGYDWTKISDWETFCLMIESSKDFSFILGDDINDYQLYKNIESDEVILLNPYTEDKIKENDMKVIKDHINSMLGYIYKEHRERPDSKEIKELIIKNERLRSEKSQKCNISMIDIVFYQLYLNTKDLELSSELNDSYDISKHAYRLGVLNSSRKIAELIINYLKEITNE